MYWLFDLLVFPQLAAVTPPGGLSQESKTIALSVFEIAASQLGHTASDGHEIGTKYLLTFDSLSRTR